MSIRYLGFLLLLIWFPGALHVQSAAQCSSPRLDGGYFVPVKETYPHESELTYACDEGCKPVVEGWWATSTCQDGKWSHEPQCIDKAACIPPSIPNAKYAENSNGGYKDGHLLKVTCEDGYQPQNNTTAECKNGTWLSVPVCERSVQACDAPAVIPHAVIINQGYQDVFAENTEVEYECEEGFSRGAHIGSSIRCSDGVWTTGPPCSIRYFYYERTSQLLGRDLQYRPKRHETHQVVSGGQRCVDPKIVGNYVSREVILLFLSQNTGELCCTFVRVTRPGAGSDEYTHHADTNCYVDTHLIPALKFVGTILMYDGEEMDFRCNKLPKWWWNHHSVARCNNGKTTFTKCCNKGEHLLVCDRCLTIPKPDREIDLCTSDM